MSAKKLGHLLEAPVEERQAREAVAKFMVDVKDSMKALEQALAAQKPLPCGSRLLSFAIESGLPPQMAYSVTETAKYTGIKFQTLYGEINAGRLHTIIPKGNERGALISVDEMERWVQENSN